MNIESLDEYEGLTAEMVRTWLAENGWTLRDGGTMWCKPGRSGIAVPDEVLVSCIAYAEQRSPQVILREMNPRLRPWPSTDARAAHRGFWLAVCSQDGTACMGKFRPDVEWFAHSGNLILTEEDSFALYWPCDAHGNKVRYPTVAPDRSGT